MLVRLYIKIVICKVALISAIATCIPMMINLIIAKLRSNEELISLDTLSKLSDITIIGITIIVVSVPEGLPLAVTLALAYSVGKMKDEHNLVRQLESCETMGGANNICSDKTGTLTKNEMTVTAIYCEEKVFTDVKNWASIFNGRDSISGLIKQKLCENVCVNSTAFIICDPISNKKKRMGNATECALLSFANELGTNFLELRKQENEALSIAFTSTRKRMTTVIKNNEEGSYTINVKGAPDILLDRKSVV